MFFIFTTASVLVSYLNAQHKISGYLVKGRHPQDTPKVFLIVQSSTHPWAANFIWSDMLCRGESEAGKDNQCDLIGEFEWISTTSTVHNVQSPRKYKSD